MLESIASSPSKVIDHLAHDDSIFQFSISRMKKKSYNEDAFVDNKPLYAVRIWHWRIFFFFF